MKITEVKVFAAKDGGRLKAYATIVFDNVFIVRDIKVIEDQDGFFLSMPSRRRKDGTFRDIAHPLTSEMRKLIETAVITEYKRAVSSGDMSTQNPDDAA